MLQNLISDYRYLPRTVRRLLWLWLAASALSIAGILLTGIAQGITIVTLFESARLILSAVLIYFLVARRSRVAYRISYGLTMLKLATGVLGLLFVATGFIPLGSSLIVGTALVATLAFSVYRLALLVDGDTERYLGV